MTSEYDAAAPLLADEDTAASGAEPGTPPPVVAQPEQSPPAAAAEPEAAPSDPTPAGETFVITSNSGRTVITVRLEPDVTAPDGAGGTQVVRTGEGMVSAERDGLNIFAHPLMPEGPAPTP